MPQFRKKPVTIEAIQIFKNMGADNWYDLPKWLRDGYEKADILFLSDGVNIRTLEGIMKGNIGDWIIQGVKGELYPCKDDIFTMTYDPIE
jgi:hypothetical protein